MAPPGAERRLNEIVDPKLAAELRRVELRTRRAIDSGLMGGYRSAFRGAGLTFTDLREYAPGDEVKHIHWKASARTGRMYVKSYEEERQLTVVLVLDVSRSTGCGGRRTTHERALEFSALVALLARQSNDALGMCLFGEKIEAFFPAGRRRGQAQRLMLALLRSQPLGAASNLAEALRYVQQHQRRRAVIFVVSDFYTPPFEEQLRRLAFRHDVICTQLERPPLEELPSAGLVEFADAESGRRRLLDCSSSLVREAYRQFQQQHLRRVQEICRCSGADYLALRDRPLQASAELMYRRTRRQR